MNLYLLKLFVGKPSGLVDHGVGNSDLADIVKEGHHVYLFLTLSRISVTLRDFIRVVGHTSGMALCISVLCVDRVRERMHHMQRKSFNLGGLAHHLSVKVALQPDQIEQVPYTECQNLGNERLSDEIHRSERQSFMLGALTLVSCKEDDRNLGCC